MTVGPPEGASTDDPSADRLGSRSAADVKQQEPILGVAMKRRVCWFILGVLHSYQTGDWFNNMV